LDALSWISVIVVALAAVAIALGWLMSGREYDHHARWISAARGTLTGLLLAGFLLLSVEVFATDGAKETVFDGWLDSVADSIDGTSDREERIAREQEDSMPMIQSFASRFARPS
jgi:hypothetical protein